MHSIIMLVDDRTGYFSVCLCTPVQNPDGCENPDISSEIQVNQCVLVFQRHPRCDRSDERLVGAMRMKYSGLDVPVLWCHIHMQAPRCDDRDSAILKNTTAAWVACR